MKNQVLPQTPNSTPQTILNKTPEIIPNKIPRDLSTEFSQDFIKKLSDSFSSYLSNLGSGSSQILGHFNFTGENTSYTRYNQGQIRQSTQVHQGDFSLLLQCEQRQWAYSWALSGNFDEDFKKGLTCINSFKKDYESLDPNESVISPKGTLLSEFQQRSQCYPDLVWIDSIIQENHLDLAGLLASGSQVQAQGNSLGQFHWYETQSHFFDYSVYTTDPMGQSKSLKKTYYALHWDNQTFRNQIAEVQEQLPYFQNSSKEIPKGQYRAFLTPSAVAELLSLLSFGALSFDTYKKGLSPFKKLIEKQVQLSDLFNFRENFSLGLCSQFNSFGEIRPSCMDLIKKGSLEQLFVSSASASEYGVASNQAEPVSSGFEIKESPKSSEILGGSLPSSEVLKALDTGLYLGNLHYCNWSDTTSARITGMTRFGCFWVENGRIVCPIKDFRFDSSFFDLFGPSGLEALTQEVEVIPQTSTYHMRSSGGLRSPGALVRNLTCVL
jgi:predicted Zn-dependent protease